MARAVSSESMTTVLPSGSTSCAPYDHSNGYNQPWLSPKPWPNSKPNGWPAFFNLMPASSSPSQVSGKSLMPTSPNQSERQFMSWPTLPKGTAFHLPLTIADSLMESYQPPFFLPI